MSGMGVTSWGPSTSPVPHGNRDPRPQKAPLSPRGRGLRRLSERELAEPERGEGAAPRGAQRVSASEAAAAQSLALLRARAAVAAPPLIQLRPRGRMSAFADGDRLRLAKAPYPSP